MTALTANRRPRSHWWLWLLALAAVAFLAYLGWICVRIVREASLQEVHPADAIVVFGAANAGTPPLTSISGALLPSTVPVWIMLSNSSIAALPPSLSPQEGRPRTPATAKAAWVTNT